MGNRIYKTPHVNTTRVVIVPDGDLIRVIRDIGWGLFCSFTTVLVFDKEFFVYEEKGKNDE